MFRATDEPDIAEDHVFKVLYDNHENILHHGREQNRCRTEDAFKELSSNFQHYIPDSSEEPFASFSLYNEPLTSTLCAKWFNKCVQGNIGIKEDFKLVDNPFRTLHYSILRQSRRLRLRRPLRLYTCKTSSALRIAAAEIIYACWERYVLRCVYVYLRKLVHYYALMNPRLLWRYLNPEEVELMRDPATGTHLHFRLGGYNFPPVVMYKIYTSRPVVSVLNRLVSIYKESHDNRDKNELNSWRPWTDCHSKPSYFSKCSDNECVKRVSKCKSGRKLTLVNSKTKNENSVSSQKRALTESSSVCSVLTVKPLLTSSEDDLMSTDDCEPTVEEEELISWVQNLRFDDT